MIVIPIPIKKILGGVKLYVILYDIYKFDVLIYVTKYITTAVVLVLIVRSRIELLIPGDLGVLSIEHLAYYSRVFKK